MGNFQKIIASVLILSFLLQVSINSLYAEAEFYSLEELPYSKIEYGVIDGSQIRENNDGEEGRRLLLDSQSQTEISHDEEKLPQHISFTYTGGEEIRTLLAEKRNFEILESTTLDPTLSFYQLPTVFQSTGNSPLDIFLTGSSQNESITLGDLLDEPIPQFVGKNYRLERKAKKIAQVPSMRKSIRFEMDPGTEVRTSSGEMIEMSNIGFSGLDGSKQLLAKKKFEKKMKNRGVKAKGQSEASVQGFEFGYSGVHLLFSKPVKIIMDVDNITNGNAFDLLTLHAGDVDFHTGGLSVDPNTICNTDGSASIPGATALVKNGKVTFYTCGASSFTINPSGGIAGSNDLRLVIGDCGQFQLYYSGAQNIYTGNPPATGCSNTMDAWIALRIGATTYGSDWTAWSTNVTSGTSNGNAYTGTTTLTRVVGGRTYTVQLIWRYIAPNKYFNIDWSVNVPTGNTNNIRFYIANDSLVSGSDANDTGYTGSAPSRTIGVYDSVVNQLSAIRYISGPAWTAEQANAWNTVRGQITSGANFTNAIQTTPGDLGFGVNWDFGTTVGTYTGTIEWRLIPYTAGSTVDLIPGIGAPEGPLTSNLLSQLPITISNAGSLSSSGVHTVILTVPVNITGPASPFTDNGWSCGAQIGTGVTCTKTTSVTGSLAGDESLRIPVTPTLAASGTTVTFYVDISGGGDSNLTNNRAFSVNSVVGGVSAIDPGGITGENLWFMANNGTNCTLTGCTITSWTNRGGLGAAASGTTAAGTVLYDPGASINYNPTLYFNNASLNTNNNLGITASSASVFAVTKIGAGGTFQIGPQTAVANAMQWSTSPTTDVWQRYTGLVFYNGANSRSASIPAITTTLRQVGGTSSGYTNGRQVLSSTTAGNFTAASIGIGRVVATNATLTNLAEVIVYPNGLTDAQRNQVESYLAIKYGISLDQTLPTSYLGSNGTTIWNASTAGTYKNNIAGIARDDATTLNQNRSQSIYNTGDIIVYKAAIGTNRNALVWSNDSGSTLTFTGNDIGSGYQRITREWFFQEKNGDIGSVTISYPQGSVPAGFTGTLMLFTDTDSSFALGATAYTGTYNTGTLTWDFTLNISDLQYVTFGKTVPIDTSPPSITSISIASGTLIPKGIFSLTVNYTDTGAGINAASFSGRIYPWDATGSTWSTTNIAGSYMLYSGIPNTSSGGFDITNLPYGKYRFDIVIADTLGNTLIQSYTYYVDAVEWILSTPIYDIGNAPTGVSTFGSGDLIITVKTVGAGFNLTLTRTNDLTYSGQTITVYDGLNGWGYDKDIGSGYSTTLTAHGTPQTIISVPKSINANGFKNTFTYRVKFGANPIASALAGDYQGNVAFGINLNF